MNTKSVFTFTQELTQKLVPAYGDTNTAEQHAWELLQKVAGLSKLQLISRKELTINKELETLLNAWVREIVEDHKPIQYILGSVPFLDLTITVEPPILIPRPETEEWCNVFIQKLQKNAVKNTSLKILDLCTGSGCIALAIAHAFPKSTVYASDISPQAVALAQKNAKNNNITNITVIKSNLYANIPEIDFDYIIANPPYIAPEEYESLALSVSAWEDKHALIANEHGLEIIRTIIAQSPRFLRYSQKKNPSVWIEIGYQQAAAVTEIFRHAGCTTEVLKDLFGNDRVVIGNFVS